MLGIIILALIAIVALTVLGFAVHILFSPWLLVAIAILGGIVAAGERLASKREMPFVKLAGLGLNLLALVGLTLEAHDYFSRQRSALYAVGGYSQTRDIDLAWNFSYSAIWLIYGGIYFMRSNKATGRTTMVEARARQQAMG